MILRRHCLMPLAISIFMACAPEPGKVSFTFSWEGGEPTETLWLFGQVVKVDPETSKLGQVIAELAGAQEYGADMSFQFTDVPNEDNLALVLEARADALMESRVLYYGSSSAFSLAPGIDEDVDVPVTMTAAPDIIDLHIVEAVGPEDCLDCYTSKETVTLRFAGIGASSIEVANDNDFSVCKHSLTVGETGENMPRLLAGEAGWTIEGWSLDCGLEDEADGPRSVYVRLLDDMGYPSQTLSTQVVLDRQPPTEPIMNCSDGTWLIKLETTMQFGVVKADEMWVEACDPDLNDSNSCVSLQGGLEPCAYDNANYIPVDSWTDFTTQGCIRFKDDAVTAVQVKYRDFGHNETDWLRFEFENVTELELTWVPVPGGTFDMGCSQGETKCLDDEFPVHPVTLSHFEMLAREVTKGEYYAATGQSPSCLQHPIGGDDLPVECVSWFDATAFCKKVGGRLPTEAEWEYAARGGTTTRHYCGDDVECLDEIAWFQSNSDDHQHEVGGKLPNAYGLYDMLGNVWEWTADWYDPDYYAVSPKDNPQGPNGGSQRVVRGGAYDLGSDYLGVSFRWYPATPTITGDSLGFRCCRSD
jgi:formylglycine-generating enzyme